MGSQDDIGFDEAGRPIAIGDAARRRQAAIVDHPDARPILVVAEHGGEIGIRVYGPPAADTADLLDHLAATYRRALEASRARPT